MDGTRVAKASDAVRTTKAIDSAPYRQNRALNATRSSRLDVTFIGAPPTFSYGVRVRTLCRRAGSGQTRERVVVTDRPGWHRPCPLAPFPLQHGRADHYRRATLSGPAGSRMVRWTELSRMRVSQLRPSRR